MFAAVTLPDGRTLGPLVTLIIKADPSAATQQFQHIAKTTFDPVERYESAIKMLQTVYYQNPREFSDRPTQRSPGRCWRPHIATRFSRKGDSVSA